jgi:hypothetical protein
MAASAVIDLRNLAGRLNFLTKSGIEKALNKAAILVGSEVINNWNQGKDANDKKFEAYTLQYFRKKRDAGRSSGRVDFLWDGDLHRSIRFKKLSRLRRVIRPLGARNIMKLKGLTTQRNGVRGDAFRPGDRIRNMAIGIVFKSLEKANLESARKFIGK